MGQELHRIIILGAPGSGKGTQSVLISRKLNIPQISTGDILREEIREGSAVGKEAYRLVSEGKLVPDDMVIEIVEQRLKRDDCRNGYILDGFPRTVTQAQALDQHQIPIDFALFLDVDEGVILRRLAGRRVCSSCNAMFHIDFNPPQKKEDTCDKCGGSLVIRKDDEESTIRRRIRIYHDQTAPVIHYYQKHPTIRCHRIDAGHSDQDTPDVVAERISQILNRETV